MTKPVCLYRRNFYIAACALTRDFLSARRLNGPSVPRAIFEKISDVLLAIIAVARSSSLFLCIFVLAGAD